MPYLLQVEKFLCKFKLTRGGIVIGWFNLALTLGILLFNIISLSFNNQNFIKSVKDLLGIHEGSTGKLNKFK